MATALIINTDDFVGFVDISDNLNNEQKIENYIRRAQMEERKYWTNDALFVALLENKTDARFQNLIYGVSSYVDTVGDVRIFEGIAPQIAFWTAAKLVKSGHIKHTDLGYAIGRDENTRELNDTERKKMFWQLRNKAEAYEKETIEFLESNLTVYPEWDREYICRHGVLGNYR